MIWRLSALYATNQIYTISWRQRFKKTVKIFSRGFLLIFLTVTTMMMLFLFDVVNDDDNSPSDGLMRVASTVDEKFSTLRRYLRGESRQKIFTV